jgi:autotransporter family porin
MVEGEELRPTGAVLAVTVLVGLLTATLAGGVLSCGENGQVPGPAPSSEPTVVPGPGPGHFDTVPPKLPLPSGAQCASWVLASPLPENKRVNRPFNQAPGSRLAPDFFDPRSTDPRANRLIAARVDGAFNGTTQEILRWAACKWGVDEDLVYAQAAKESWWRQPSMGDWETDASACAPGHGLGADGRPGQCPQSFGILQDRYPFQHSAWPGIYSSTATNADTAYAVWRSCFEGYERWLNTVDRGRPYAAGDAWGCVGRWVSGRWYTPAATQYIAGVRAYEDRRVWEQRDFAEV